MCGYASMHCHSSFLIQMPTPRLSLFFFFNDTATTEIYTLSLHDALPISWPHCRAICQCWRSAQRPAVPRSSERPARSEEHTSELQSPCNLVCRLLLEKKKNNTIESEAMPGQNAAYRRHPYHRLTS